MNRQPRTYQATTQILPALRDADVTATAVQPLVSLRDSTYPTTRKLPNSALDLPLWRPGVCEPPVQLPTPDQEQTEIGTVAAHIVDHSVRSRFEIMRHETATACEEWGTDNDDVFRTHLTGMAEDMAQIDTIAHQAGFHAAVARTLGRRLARREISATDVLTQLQALH